MEVGVITAIAGLVGSAVTGIIGYASGKNNNKVTDRELLSKDEQAFRERLIERLTSSEEKIERLSNEVITLRQENLALIAENRLLNNKVEQLVAQLSRRRGDVR
jgi:predicted nuclease with TOPRIM domain